MSAGRLTYSCDMPSDSTPTTTLNPPALTTWTNDPALRCGTRVLMTVDVDAGVVLQIDPDTGKWFLLVTRWDVDTDRRMPMDANSAAVPGFVRLDLAGTRAAILRDQLADALTDGIGTLELQAMPPVHDGGPWQIWTVKYTRDV